MKTRSQRMLGGKSHHKTSSKYKGVHWDSKRGIWRAQIAINGKKTFLLASDNEENCAKAYDNAIRRHFKSYCCVNFPQKGEQSAI